jgi:hypothetical protein
MRAGQVAADKRCWTEPPQWASAMGIVCRNMADLARNWRIRCPLTSPGPRFLAHHRALRFRLTRPNGALCAASAWHGLAQHCTRRHWSCTANHGGGRVVRHCSRFGTITSTTCKRLSAQHGQRPMSVCATGCMSGCADSITAVSDALTSSACLQAASCSFFPPLVRMP